MDKNKKILIVGAGLSGLAMYIALNKQKFDVDIVEKRKKFRRLGYSIIFMPLGVRALKQLGFPQTQIRKIGTTVQESRLRDKAGKIKLVTNFRPLIKKFDKYMIVTRERLYKLLETKVPKKNIHFGVSVKSLTQSNDGKVHVQFEGKKAAGIYNVVIGADGIHSSVRKIIHPDSELKPLGLSFIWSWIPRKDKIYPRQMGGLGDEKSGIGFFNSGEKEKSCMAFFIQSKDVPQNIKPGGYKKLLKEHLGDFGGPVPKILKHLPSGEQMYLHEDYELNLRKWYKGNVVLIGDAAHARSVSSGAGSALALEDAFVLGHYLNNERSSRRAIEKYFNKQKKRVEQLTMSKLQLYLQDQRGVIKYLSDFFSSSLLYSKKS